MSITTILLAATCLCGTLPDFKCGVSKSNYLDLMETAVRAYSDDHLAQYLADVERDGVQEHGFPRLTANLGILIANGRLLEKRDILSRMLTVCCRDAGKRMPPKSGGNDFSIKELVLAVVTLEKAKTFPKSTTDGWRTSLSAIVAEDSYTQGRLKVGDGKAHNWVVFAAAGEQSRLKYAMGGDAAFVEKYVADQLRWFDVNGMYRDPNQPAVYDFVTRLQFALLLHDGFDGPSRAKLEALLEKSAEPTLKMLSAAGEIPFGGRSNQFLHNNTFYAALCEWYAARMSRSHNVAKRSMAPKFRRAAAKAIAAIKPWLDEKPLSHVKNRYPRELGKGVYSTNGDMGCERYAYFDKYMITMGSWAMLGWLFADESIDAANAPACCAANDASSLADVFVTSEDFHFVFLRAGDYSAQFDYNADGHYDCDGLGRIHRANAPTAICLSTPCAAKPKYRIEQPNDAPMSIAPIVAKNAQTFPFQFVRAYANGEKAFCEWLATTSNTNASATRWLLELSPTGMTITLTGNGDMGLTLPAFAFDGKESTLISSTPTRLTIAYRGWQCIYETNGTIVDTKRSACNRNGRYRRFEAHGKDNLTVTVKLIPSSQLSSITKIDHCRFWMTNK